MAKPDTFRQSLAKLNAMRGPCMTCRHYGIGNYCTLFKMSVNKARQMDNANDPENCGLDGKYWAQATVSA